VSQSRRMSLVEVATNYIIWITLSLLITYYLMPIWGLEQSVSTAMWVTAVYTVASVVRLYILRRAFNWIGELK